MSSSPPVVFELVATVVVVIPVEVVVAPSDSKEDEEADLVVELVGLILLLLVWWWLLFVFSRSACDVFSKDRGNPISYHAPVVASLAKNLPGGSVCDRIRSTICRANIIFSFLVKVVYLALLAKIKSRKF
jgi:hypothetical protein